MGGKEMSMSKLCAICGAEIPEGEEFITPEGQALCHDHFEALYHICDHCGVIHLRTELTVTEGGDLVCEECLDRDYARCEDCGNWCLVNNLIPVNPYCSDEMQVCESCLYGGDYFRCVNCGDWFTYRHEGRHDDWNTICDDCSDHFYTCTGCGCLVNEDDVRWYGDDPYCESCYDDIDDACGMHEYGYKPDPIFGTTDSTDGTGWYRGTELTFGVELECDKGRNIYEAMHETYALTDRLYIKHDGSLSDGYEVVTHPGTLAWHMTRFPWKGVCDAATKYGFKSHDAGTCGLHVHIGVNQLGEGVAERNHARANMILLVNTLWPELVRFSRRSNSALNEWAAPNRGFRELEDYLPKDEKNAVEVLLCGAEREGRYVAVNMQNASTVELRFNRGSLVPRTILATLQLASNLALFAMSHTVDECIEAKWDDVVHFVEYDELNGYVADRFRDVCIGESDRPTTTYRVARAAELRKANLPDDTNADDPFGYAARCYLIAHGADLAPEGTMPEPGDLVVCTDQIFADEDYPTSGSIGVVTGIDSRINSAYVLWGTPACVGTSALTSLENFRIIRSMRRGLVPDRRSLLTLAVEEGIVPGDLVQARDRHDVGILYFVEPGWGPVCNIAWQLQANGHNGNEDFLRNTYYARHGWNYVLSNIHRV